MRPIICVECSLTGLFCNASVGLNDTKSTLLLRSSNTPDTFSAEFCISQIRYLGDYYLISIYGMDKDDQTMHIFNKVFILRCS